MTYRPIQTAVLILCLGAGSLLAGQDANLETKSFLPDTSPFIGSEIRIPMRDGKTLAADLVLPKTSGKYPVILVQTPYNKSSVRPWFRGEGRWGSDSLFTDANYAFVVTDFRGKFASREALAPGTQTTPGWDGYDICNWIAKQAWSNGKIATYGASALARVQYETARANPPNLICSVPSVAPLVIGYDIEFPGGALWEEFVRMLTRLGFGVDLYRQLADQPMMSDRWRAIEAASVKGEDIRVPMLFIGGWYDIYTDGVLDTFDAVRTKGGDKARQHSKLIMGPWTHAMEMAQTGALDFSASQWYGMKRARAFIDYWVRGIPNDFDRKEPAISYYEMGVDQWRSTSVWPPPGALRRKFYLQPDHSLLTRAPNNSGAPALIRFDPTQPAPTTGGHVLDPALGPGPQDQREKVETRQDVLVFSTPGMEKATAIAGKAEVNLYVSSDRPDTDFTVIVTDVYPDGRSMLVLEGIQRMRFRNGTSREEFLEPAKVYPITIPLSNTAITFPKGHRIRLIVSSSNSPKYAVNRNDGGPMYVGEGGQTAMNRLYFDKEHPSALILPIEKH